MLQILHRFVCINLSNIFELDPSNKTWGHNYKIRSSRPRLDTRLHFVGYRVVAAWNQLSSATVNAPSVFSFKNLLKSEDLSIFLLNNYDAVPTK